MSITGLLAAGLLLIAGAATALVYGWVNASEGLVVTSIVLSAAAGMSMAMALYKSRPPRRPRRVRAGRSGR